MTELVNKSPSLAKAAQDAGTSGEQLLSSRHGEETAIGIIADIQYVDDEDASQWGDPTRKRRYRSSLKIFKEAIKELSFKTTTNIVLGDILDGKAKRMNQRDKSLSHVMDALSDANALREWSFVVGNHDFFSFSREELYAMDVFMPRSVAKECSPAKMYYAREISSGLVLVTLDCYEISIDGALSQSYKTEAENIIKRNNPNVASGKNWLEGLDEDKKRYVPYNGGVTDDQKLWLKAVLSDAKGKGQQVVVFSHTPLSSYCCRPSAVCWDADELSSILRDSGNVLAVFSGHDHDGGYHHEGTERGGGNAVGGLRHVIPPAPLEAPEGSSCWGVLHVSTDSATGKISSVRYAWRGEYPRELRLAIESGGELSPALVKEKEFWDGECW